MEDPHLRPAEVQRLLAYLPPQEQVMLGHVLDCETCRQRLIESLGPPPAPPVTRVVSAHDYSGLWPG
ncbi:MAG: hypothetical protein ACRDHY_07990, partial [Anaerolineales bacterium]